MLLNNFNSIEPLLLGSLRVPFIQGICKKSEYNCYKVVIGVMVVHDESPPFQSVGSQHAGLCTKISVGTSSNVTAS